jgi:hypothetical protein
MFNSKTAYSQVPAEIELESLHARHSDANDEAVDASEAQQDEEDRRMPLTASREGRWCACTAAAATATQTLPQSLHFLNVDQGSYSVSPPLQVFIHLSQRKQFWLNNSIVQQTCTATPCPVQSTWCSICNQYCTAAPAITANCKIFCNQQSCLNAAAGDGYGGSWRARPAVHVRTPGLGWWHGSDAAVADHLVVHLLRWVGVASTNFINF